MFQLSKNISTEFLGKMFLKLDFSHLKAGSFFGTPCNYSWINGIAKVIKRAII